MKFEARVIPSGNATAVEIPVGVVDSLGPEARPAIVAMINGHAWRSRVARMRGLCLVGISAANRNQSGIAEGDVVTVDLRLDEEPREVAEPEDLALALDQHSEARARFERLPFGLRRKHIADIHNAKSEAVRQRRIDKLVRTLHSDG